MKTTILAIGFALLANAAFSQAATLPYTWGVGVKYRPAALSVKTYLVKGDALEFLLSKYDPGTRLTALYEVSPKINRSGSLHLVMGPGVHVAIWDKDVKKNSYTKNPIIGFDFIFGLEYKIPGAPMAIQLDYQPSADIAGNNEFFKDWGGLTIRFAW